MYVLSVRRGQSHHERSSLLLVLQSDIRRSVLPLELKLDSASRFIDIVQRPKRDFGIHPLFESMIPVLHHKQPLSSLDKMQMLKECVICVAQTYSPFDLRGRSRPVSFEPYGIDDYTLKLISR